MKVLITTVPFGEKDRTPLTLLEEAGLKYTINPLGRKLTEDDLVSMLPSFDILIAGTEPITRKVLEASSRVKFISRVGIGLDSVDLEFTKANGIGVSYTPDAPAPAVAELTLGLILSLLRSVQLSNIYMHERKWHRYFGKRITECTIGLIGTGRIGSSVARFLDSLNCKRLLLNDVQGFDSRKLPDSAEWVSKDTIYQESDLISLHLPLTAETSNMITEKELRLMHSDAFLINTSRGGIVNEQDLYNILKEGHLAGAALDVFENEPYMGNLAELNNCLLTAHMGSMSVDCRAKMEIEATQEAVRFFKGEVLHNPVPEEEYAMHMRKNNRGGDG